MATVVGTSSPGRLGGWSLSLAVLVSCPAVALDWDIEPVLSVSTILTDNVSRDRNGEESLVLQVSPGVSLRRQGARASLGLDYNLQNLYYSHSGNFDAFQQLLGTGTTELVRDRLFIDVDGSIGQTSAGTGASLLDDNIAGSGDRSTFYSLSVNPYWRNDFAGYAESLISYDAGYVDYNSDRASDSFDQGLSAELVSGRRFTTLRWSLGASLSRLDRDRGQDSEEQSLAASVSYALTDEWRLVAEAGYEEADLTSQTFEGEDGSYWRGGVTWLPSRYLQATGLVGNDNSRFALRFYPTVRTALEVSRLDQNVGIDAGVSWSGAFSHRTRYSSWRLSYLDEVTSVQRLAFMQLGLDDEGRIVDNAGQPVDLRDLLGRGGVFLGPGGLFLLTDEEFNRQRAALDVSYVRRRNSFSVGFYTETRDYGGDIDSEQVLGGNAGWTLVLAPRTSTSVIGEWQQEDNSDDLGDDNGQDQAWSLETQLQHDFPNDMTGRVSYLHIQGGMDESSAGEDYQENRINLLLQVTF